MDKKEKQQIQMEFILDLMELKSHNLKMQSLSIQRDLMVQNNMFYSMLDTLISHFLDKYKIPYEVIREEFYKRDREIDEA